jgi:hypothetical protein
MRLVSRIVFAFLFLAVLFPVLGQSQTATRKTRLRSSQSYCAGATPCVLTAHNDNNRDGINSHESVFKASTLSDNSPKPRWLATTDGMIYAQPLYIHQLSIGGSTKNTVYAVTENNSVYAFDSDSASSSGAVLAQVNLNTASDLSEGSTEIAVPYLDLPVTCTLVVPEVGITGTPVIDISVTPPVIYVVSKHEDVDSQGVKTYRQKLHGLYADTLQEIPGSPVILDSNFASKFAPGLDPLYHLQRPGLALVHSANGSAKIWVAWGSTCDKTPYSGFAVEFTYNYGSTPDFSSTYTVVNTSSSCAAQPCKNGIWMSGAAPAVDANGNLYVSSGNGADEYQGDGEYSNSILRINDNGLQDFYTPPDFHALNAGKTVVACTNPHPSSCPKPCAFDGTGQYCQIKLEPDDWDLGAGGVLLLSPSFNLNNPEILASGKQGMVYVAYANSLGHIDAHSANPDQYACTSSSTPKTGAIAQCFQGFPVATDPKENDSGLRGSPAFLAGNPGSQYNFLYTVAMDDVLKVFLFQGDDGVGRFLTTPGTAILPHHFNYGASPMVSWNNGPGGSIKDGIVWVVDTPGAGRIGHGPISSEVLYAYRAIPISRTPSGALGKELWNSSDYSTTKPGNPGSVKFVTPIVVDGKIFVGGGAQGYDPGSDNCPVPSPTLQPTACGGLAMFQ